MRRNQHLQDAPEPSWWHQPEPEPSDNNNPFAPDMSAIDTEGPLTLLTHTASPLRLIDPQDPPPGAPPALTGVTPAPDQPAVETAPAVETMRQASPVGIGADHHARQLATCFAIDYLSWDVADPARRAIALTRYLPRRSGSAARPTGWSGHGRQRVSFAVAGATHQDERDPDVLWIDVRALVTRYEPTATDLPRCAQGAVQVTEPGGFHCHPSSVPAPDAPGWRALGSQWMHIAVPLSRDESGNPHVTPDLEPSDLYIVPSEGA